MTLSTDGDNGNNSDRDESWVEKYRPESWDEIQGNNKNIKEIKRWAKNWSTGDDPILLLGEAGTGKTSTAQVISNELGYPINQINTSDKRDADAIKGMVSTIRSTPTMADHQLILLDEVDSWESRTNTQPLAAVLNNPNNPVVLTANEHWNVPSGIKRAAREFEFKLGRRSRMAKLREIRDNENLDLDDGDLETLANRPDLRSAINDMQRWAERGLPPDSDEREWGESPFEVVERILRGGTDTGYEMDPSDLLYWLDQNLCNEYRGVEAAKAYETLAQADKFLQTAHDIDFSFWRYAGELEAQIGNLRLTDAYDGYMNIDFPEWFQKSEPSIEDDTPEAKLYRAIKGLKLERRDNKTVVVNDDSTYEFSGGYTYFRKVLLPLLNRMSEEQRLEIALHYQLEDDEIKALDLTPTDYEFWSVSEVPDDRQIAEARINSSSALDW